MLNGISGGFSGNLLPRLAPHNRPNHRSDADESSVKGNTTSLTEEEKKEVEELKKRDREVRQHEAAHKGAAGQYAQGGPSFEYQTGPDGKRYAVGGEVKIDTSKEKTPEETIRKAQQIRRAALAPKDPSAQDRRVAAEAARMEAEARRELREEEQPANQSDRLENVEDSDSIQGSEGSVIENNDSRTLSGLIPRRSPVAASLQYRLQQNLIAP